MRKFTLLAAALAIMAFGTGAAYAQNAYPTQPVRVIIPFPAGSTTDALTRIVADGLGRKWGKAVVVENIPGMNIGAERVARADPDGYTLLASPPSPLTINKLLYRNLPYDPDKLEPITLLATAPNVFDIRKDLPVNSVKEFIAYAKARPGKLTYASQGVGSTAQLSSALLEQMAGITMLHVPYRGALPALNDVIAGHVDMFFDTATTSVPMARSGQIKIIAVGSTKRISTLADVPTMEEFWPARLSLGHLVCAGRAARDAGVARRQDQSRHRRGSQGSAGQRKAAQASARSRCDQPGRHQEVL